MDEQTLLTDGLLAMGLHLSDAQQKHMPMTGCGKSINECLGMSSTCQDVDLLILICLNEKRPGIPVIWFQIITVTSVI